MVDEADISTSGRRSVGEILLPHKKRVKSVQRSSRIRGYSNGKIHYPASARINSVKVQNSLFS
jgi:hypothetical protein